MAFGDKVFFRMLRLATGWELWVTDGTANGTVLFKDINPGTAGSDPRFMVEMAGKLYFTANDGQHGTELWVSDGTPNGTLMLADINQGSESSDPQWLTPVGTTLYFMAKGGSEGRQLWKYDASTQQVSRIHVINTQGDCEGNILVQNSAPGWGSSVFRPRYYNDMFPVHIDEEGHRIYFTANNGVHGYELWQSDGSEQGTFMVADICAACQTNQVTHIRYVQSKLIFNTQHPLYGAEPWILDPAQAINYSSNLPPVASMSATPTQGNAPLSVSFDGSASYDPDGNIILYEWDFGDGNTASGQALLTTDHTYQNPGTYTATLTVKDNDNATSSANVTITVSSASAYVYVDAQSVSRVSKPGNRWAGRSVITIKDNANAVVAGATVTASYSGPSSGTVSGTTASNGTVELETGAIKNPSGSWCFTVSNVSAAYAFNATVGVPYKCEGSPKRGDAVPEAVALGQNHPNPFSSTTRIDFAVAHDGHVTLTVYDLLGRALYTLLDAHMPAGRHSVPFDAAGLPSGTYIYRLDAQGARLVRMMQVSW